MFERGDIARFNYLWARQADQGEVAGRKPRPVCVVIRLPGTPARLFLFPITTQPPAAGRIAIAFPEMERWRAGFDQPCWLILDEYNRIEIDKAYDFESVKPLGRISPAFLRKTAERIQTAAREGRLKGVSRG